jgi:spore coat protein A
VDIQVSSSVAVADEATNAGLPFPSLVNQFFGNFSVVNGKIWPKKTVRPEAYRLRILSLSNARFYSVGLFEYDESTGTVDLNKPGPPFVQIGGDHGFLPQPLRINPADRLTLGVAERADVLVDFSGYEGKSLLLHNSAQAPFAVNVPPQLPLPEIMLFKVNQASTPEEANSDRAPSSSDRAKSSSEASNSQAETPAEPAGDRPPSRTPSSSEAATAALLSTPLPPFVPVCKQSVSKQG